MSFAKLAVECRPTVELSSFKANSVRCSIAVREREREIERERERREGERERERDKLSRQKGFRKNLGSTKNFLRHLNNLVKNSNVVSGGII